MVRYRSWACWVDGKIICCMYVCKIQRLSVLKGREWGSRRRYGVRDLGKDGFAGV